MMGFTKNEKKILIMLSMGFLAGLGVRIYNENYRPIPVLNIKSEPVDGGKGVQIFEGATAFDTGISEPRIKSPSIGKININEAKTEELMRIPGIGPVLAERIVAYRQQKGVIHTPEQLTNIKGMGPKTITKIREYIIFNSIEEEQ